MYNNKLLPIVPGTAIVAIGYFWILLSSLAAAMYLGARFVIERIFPRDSDELHSPARRRWLQAAGVIALGAPAAVAGFGVLVERRRYRVLELDLPVEGLHPDLDGFRIAQVSDLHVSPFLSPGEAGRAIDMANEMSPDLAVFTGDLISELGDPLDEAIRELVRLRAGFGVLGCMGNHEAYVGCRRYLEQCAARAGVRFLRGESSQIRRGEGLLNIAGVDYQRSSDRKYYLPGAERLTMPGVTNLLLSHNPDVFPTAVARGFQAVLSGHTHGGQVNVEILHQNINPARFRTPFVSGLYRLGGASCFVTNGIGTIGMPLRLGAPPEIALLRLRMA
jgi:predicted MPP superfamily phosphohydrolase